MKAFFLLLAHLLVTIARLLRPGGTRAVVANSLLMKHQLMMMNRGRCRAPKLSMWDRLFLGFWSLSLAKLQISRTAVSLKPSTDSSMVFEIRPCLY